MKRPPFQFLRDNLCMSPRGKGYCYSTHFQDQLLKPQDERKRILRLEGYGNGSVAGRSDLQGEPVSARGRIVLEDRINAAKLLRACGGCLGARRRRRAWKTAISPGEWSNAC